MGIDLEPFNSLYFLKSHQLYRKFTGVLSVIFETTDPIVNVNGLTKSAGQLYAVVLCVLSKARTAAVLLALTAACSTVSWFSLPASS